MQPNVRRCVMCLCLWWSRVKVKDWMSILRRFTVFVMCVGFAVCLVNKLSRFMLTFISTSTPSVNPTLGIRLDNTASACRADVKE